MTKREAGLVKRAKILALKAEGKSIPEIALLLGCSKQSVRQWLDPERHRAYKRASAARRKYAPKSGEALTWENALAADGARVVAWLEQTGEIHRITAASPDHSSTISMWRRGHPAGFWALDRLLTRLGLHPSMLPADIWIDARAVAA